MFDGKEVFNCGEERGDEAVVLAGGDAIPLGKFAACRVQRVMDQRQNLLCSTKNIILYEKNTEIFTYLGQFSCKCNFLRYANIIFALLSF